MSNAATNRSHLYVGLLDAVCLTLELLSTLLCVTSILFVSSGVNFEIHVNITSVYACLMLCLGIFLASSFMCNDTSVKSCNKFLSLSDVFCVGV